MNLLLINGPNLNLLGTREKEIYGETTLLELEENLTQLAKAEGCNLDCIQTNAEHKIIDAIHNAKLKNNISAIIINPGAFTHTSVALRDAILGVDIPLIEIHISNIFNREAFREKSYFSDIAVGIISGFGEQGYKAALELAIERF